MLLSLSRSVAPVETPITLAEAKAHLRVDWDDSDDYITALIDAAVARMDGWSGVLGRCMVNQSWTLTFDSLSQQLYLPFPVNSITSVKYYDVDNSEQTINASNYELVTTLTRPYINFTSTYSIPVQYDYRTDRASVIVVAGYGAAASDVPASIKHAMKMLVAHWYEHRESVIMTSSSVLPQGFDAIIEPHRRSFLL